MSMLEHFQQERSQLEKGSGPNSAKHPKGRLRLLGPDPFSSSMAYRDRKISLVRDLDHHGLQSVVIGFDTVQNIIDLVLIGPFHVSSGRVGKKFLDQIASKKIATTFQQALV